MNNKPSEKETELNGEDVGVLGTMFLRTGQLFAYEWPVLLYASFFKRCRNKNTIMAGYSAVTQSVLGAVKNAYLLVSALHKSQVANLLHFF